MAFGVKASDLEVTSRGIPAPYLGGLKLVDVNKDNPSKKEGAKEFVVLQFVFEATDEGPAKGARFTHIEWDPDNGYVKGEDLEKRNISASKRIGHIVEQFVPVEDKQKAKAFVESKLNGETWAQYVDVVFDVMDKKIGKKVYSAKEDLKGKILGWLVTRGENKGKPKTGFPGYIGFLSDDRSKQPVSFGPDEIEANQKYLKKINQSSDDMEDADADGDEGFTYAAAPKKAVATDDDAPATTADAEDDGDDSDDPWGA